MFALAFTIALAVVVEKQDPCAGCDEGLSIEYQKCAREHGNPCALVAGDHAKEDWMKGQVVQGEGGVKKDGGCCLKKEKHDRCLQCKSMDCSHNTCTVNKRYYSERKVDETDENWAEDAKKDAGWGF